MATLTYAESPPELVPEHLSGFIRRFRKIYPAPIRFFGVGEYGDIGGRPHYHIAMFGVSIVDEEYVKKAWSDERGQIGMVHLAELNEKTAQYICGYVTKKLNKKDDYLLGGRHPEFARMSLRPGIGALAINTLKGAIAPNGDVSLMHAAGDVPSSFRSAGRQYPLGRYLRGKLRESIGWKKELPDKAKADLAESYRIRSEEEVLEHEKKRFKQADQAKTRLTIDRGKKRL